MHKIATPRQRTETKDLYFKSRKLRQMKTGCCSAALRLAGLAAVALLVQGCAGNFGSFGSTSTDMPSPLEQKIGTRLRDYDSRNVAHLAILLNQAIPNGSSGKEVEDIFNRSSSECWRVRFVHQPDGEVWVYGQRYQPEIYARWRPDHPDAAMRESYDKFKKTQYGFQCVFWGREKLHIGVSVDFSDKSLSVGVVSQF